MLIFVNKKTNFLTI